MSYDLENPGLGQEPILIPAIMPQFTYGGTGYGITIYDGLFTDNPGLYGKALDYVYDNFAADGVEGFCGSAGKLDITRFQLGAERPIGIATSYFDPDTHLLGPNDPVVVALEPQLLQLFMQYLGKQSPGEF